MFWNFKKKVGSEDDHGQNNSVQTLERTETMSSLLLISIAGFDHWETGR